MEPVKCSRYGLSGVIGARLRANECCWLMKAPGANPGLLGMFAERDSGAANDLVPWAGEFVGKYLISAIQAIRFSSSPALRAQTAQLIARTIAFQAEDGYLGPFARNIRLKANWDLWGHYHMLVALLLWHDDSGDTDALKAAIRIGDLICNTFLNTGLRVKDVGSAEMNMAVIHGLGLLYLRTHTAKYLAMMREIETDWQSAGNYLRTGLEGIPFYETPHPRWESLHDLQGLGVLYTITRDKRYLQALEAHWRSILRWDVHNSGAFSTSEGAVGDAYAPGAVETCCTVAWMLLCVDYLGLTGDVRAADALEMALYNTIAGAQSPDGAWFTYDTPMDGARIPSYSALAFQARPDTPGLNCCSVNGPRGLTMLSDWAVMRAGKGLAVNFYGPGTFDGTLNDDTPVKLEWQTGYPLDGRIKIVVNPDKVSAFPLLLRIPAWSKKSHVNVVSAQPCELPTVKPGTYLTIDREWSPGDAVEIDFDMHLRVVPGDKSALGKVSVYRGPVLLAYDTANNAGPAVQPPTLTAKSLANAHVQANTEEARKGSTPWLTVTVKNPPEPNTILSDFAGAGAGGNTYYTWLPAAGAPVPTPSLCKPDDGAMVHRDTIVLTWSAPPDVHELSYRVLVSEHPDLMKPIIDRRCLNGTTYSITNGELRKLKSGTFYFWHVALEGRRGPVLETKFPSRFIITP